MDKDISDWRQFASRVEAQLELCGSGIFSSCYQKKLGELIGQIKTETDSVEGLAPTEKQNAYMRISRLSSELKTTAYFTQ